LIAALLFCFLKNYGKAVQLNDPHQRLAVFQSDSGITLSFGEATYFIETNDPFHNIACKALAKNDYVPFYIEIAKREGVGPEFLEALQRQIQETETGD